MNKPQDNPIALPSQLTPEEPLSEETSEASSDVSDLAIQEAVRATTPKRRAIKLVKKKSVRPSPPPLMIEQILMWADAYKERTGRWPTIKCGPILEGSGEEWSRVDSALRKGLRGLPSGSSLPRLLEEHRGARNIRMLPDLTVDMILRWMDHHHAQTGEWPCEKTGTILAAPGESWSGVQSALRAGCRSLPRGSSLASLLADYRGVRNRKRLAHLRIEQILSWADAYHERYGKWPKSKDGPIEGTQGETWTGVSVALRVGQRGLPGGTSLPLLLAKERGAPYQGDPVALSVALILSWADAWYLQYGTWPKATLDPVFEGAEMTWTGVDRAARKGLRGLLERTSLPRLLETHRGVRHRRTTWLLTREQILEWADLHKERTGKWPTHTSGEIPEARGEKWSTVDEALRFGRNGLAKGSSLSALLAEERGRRDNTRTPPLTETQILQWADAYYVQTGKWPTHNSGPIPGVPEETWAKVNNALSQGQRSLAKGSSLAKLLRAQRGARR